MSIAPSKIFKTALATNKNTQIKLLGDSITHGMGGSDFCPDGYSFIDGFSRNPKGYCWAKKFKEFMEANYGCTVLNNGCSGTNIQFVIDKFDKLVYPQDDINNIYKAAAQKCDFPLISLYDLFNEYCKVSGVTVDSLLRDGLHPNDEGYDVMLKLLLQTLEIN